MTSIDKQTPPAEQESAEQESPATETDIETAEAARIQVAVTAALERKAEQLAVLDIAAISDFTDHFLICNGTNERQVQAIADNVTRQLRAGGLKPLHVEGQRHGRWILLDYGGEMVIHIFLGETRRFYALERLWADAPDVTAQFVR